MENRKAVSTEEEKQERGVERARTSEGGARGVGPSDYKPARSSGQPSAPRPALRLLPSSILASCPLSSGGLAFAVAGPGRGTRERPRRWIPPAAARGRPSQDERRTEQEQRRDFHSVSRRRRRCCCSSKKGPTWAVKVQLGKSAVIQHIISHYFPSPLSPPPHLSSSSSSCVHAPLIICSQSSSFPYSPARPVGVTRNQSSR